MKRCLVPATSRSAARNIIDGPRILAVILARGGRKGIRLKNLREVGGILLVGHATRVPRAVGVVDQVVTSTDHPKVARVSTAAAGPSRSSDRLNSPEIASEMQGRSGMRMMRSKHERSLSTI
ncbi:MAG: hypothetical protein WD005_00910 [Haliea sp.]